MVIDAHCKNGLKTCSQLEPRTFELERDPSTPWLVPRPSAQDDSIPVGRSNGLPTHWVLAKPLDLSVKNEEFDISLRFGNLERAEE